ncbi:DUF4294 domain-containing protein [Flavobacterium sp.]|uniref:DUF4294 domain-containing protein n=1 Tax=Flavobacterium sp. TaxID=239 RepID=UPI0035289AE4
MKLLFLFINVLLCNLIFSQIQEQDTLKVTKQDSSILYSFELKELVISEKGKLSESQKRLIILKRRVFKTYPYAKATAEKLVKINTVLAQLKTKKEKKKYLKIAEDYLQKEFEPRLKKLSRKDGQILVKLIARQTGESTFNLIKDYKSGWKAFWSNNTAKLFDIDLKKTYKPYDVFEDFQIESILVTAFRQKHLVEQPPAKPIDLKDLANSWREKAKKLGTSTSENEED